MSEFRVVRKADVRAVKRLPNRVPQARLHKSGTLFLSACAVEALGSQDCRIVVEFNETTLVLKFTVVDQVPGGFTEEDLFHLSVKNPKNRNHRPTATLYVKTLLNFIGCRINGTQEFAISAIDPLKRSISFVLPAEMFCDGSSN